MRLNDLRRRRCSRSCGRRRRRLRQSATSCSRKHRSREGPNIPRLRSREPRARPRQPAGDHDHEKPSNASKIRGKRELKTPTPGDVVEVALMKVSMDEDRSGQLTEDRPNQASQLPVFAPWLSLAQDFLDAIPDQQQQQVADDPPRARLDLDRHGHTGQQVRRVAPQFPFQSSRGWFTLRRRPIPYSARSTRFPLRRVASPCRRACRSAINVVNAGGGPCDSP